MKTQTVYALAVLALLSQAGAVTLSGNVRNMTAGGAPVPEAEVTLFRIGAEGPETVATAVSDRNGQFEFSELDVDTAHAYSLRTSFAGLPQTSDLFALRAGDMRRDLAVHDTTSSPDGISVGRLHLIVHPIENGVELTSVFVLRNDGPIYVGEDIDLPGAPAGTRVTMRFNVPDAAEEFRFLQGSIAPEPHHVFTRRGVASTLPFYPGGDTLVFAYKQPWEAGVGGMTFEHASPYPVESLNIVGLVGAVDIDVPGAVNEPNPDMPNLLNLEHGMIPAGEPVSITIRIPDRGFSTAQWMLVSLGVGLLIVIVAAIIIRDRRSRQTPTERAGSVHDSELTDRTAEPRDADALAEQIAELDEQFELDEIEPEAYVARRRELKAQLMDALENE